MCEECRRMFCSLNCPRFKTYKIGNCGYCDEDLYKDSETWIDDDGNKFCCEDCAKDYHGIKEMN